jgi:hypothetical protein
MMQAVYAWFCGSTLFKVVVQASDVPCFTNRQTLARPKQTTNHGAIHHVASSEPNGPDLANSSTQNTVQKVFLAMYHDSKYLPFTSGLQLGPV